MRSPATPESSLSAPQRATLAAAARRIVPHAFETGSHARADLVEVLDAQVAALRPASGADFRLALDLFGHALAALCTVGRPRRFADLPPGSQDRMLEAWGRSRVPLQRTAMQAMRRLVLATYYGLPEGQAVTGYLGPFHRRAPVYAWEGPLPAGAGDPDGPVARRGDSATAPRGAPPEHHDTTGLTVAPDPRIALRSEASPTALPAGVSTGHTFRTGTRLSADVVVIGTGAGGGVAATRLAEAGLDVVVLERGGYYTAAQFTEHEAEMHERLYAERGLRATDDLSTSLLQGECVGGGTTVNWLIMLRPPDRVLDEWARRFGSEGMSPAELAPVFDLVEAEVHAREVPDEAHSPNNRIVLDGARALGWSARAGRVNAKGCVRSGFCGQGCRYDAKQGTLVAYLPRALRAGARLFADANVQRVQIVGRGAAAGAPARGLPRKRVTAHVTDRDTGERRELVVEAPVVVLAAGAVETPALLQRSGLGTGGGVGRFLRLHPTTAVIGRYDRDIYASSGIPLSAVCDEFADRDGAGYGYWIECPPLHPALGAAALPGFGDEHRRLMAGFPRLGSLIALVRDGADTAASNGSVAVDRTGRTRISYRLGARDRVHMIEAMESAAQLHLACGAREVRTLHTRPVLVRDESDLAEIRRRPQAPNDYAMFSAHLNGTCRLGTDPRTSGALPTGECHGAPGVYVCDGSLLPTAPGVNPQEIIMAVATVVAAGIAARFR